MRRAGRRWGALAQVAALAMLATAARSMAAEACTEQFRYRLLDAGSADRLSVSAPERAEALAAVDAVLNRIGAQGWEIASQNAIEVYSELDPATNRSAWQVRFVPDTVLVKKRIRECP